VSKVVSKLPEGTYIELVRGLMRTVLPTSIMVLSFAATGMMVSLQTQDRMLLGLTALGILAGAGRLSVLLAGRLRSKAETFSLRDARHLERWFAVAYLSFATIFSLFSWRAFLVASSDVHVLIASLLVGYAAGVAAGVSFRPWISVPAIVIAVIPTMMVALVGPNSAYRATGCLLALFLFGGVQSVLSRYRYAASSITTGLLFAALARTDALTGLANRLGLAERFHEITATIASRNTTAVHCLDLDHFKPVNDRYGHPIGDLLLKAVADRLSRSLRAGDVAARVGGDEFVVIQTGMGDPGEADLMGRRLVRALAEPYDIGDHVISIGVSIGYALSSTISYDLDQIIAAADGALLQAKVQRGAARRAEPWGKLVQIR
jgi:diguanylate cyclase (GGDEF)-like protein